MHRQTMMHRQMLLRSRFITQPRPNALAAPLRRTPLSLPHVSCPARASAALPGGEGGGQERTCRGDKPPAILPSHLSPSLSIQVPPSPSSLRPPAPPAPAPPAVSEGRETAQAPPVSRWSLLTCTPRRATVQVQQGPGSPRENLDCRPLPPGGVQGPRGRRGPQRRQSKTGKTREAGHVGEGVRGRRARSPGQGRRGGRPKTEGQGRGWKVGSVTQRIQDSLGGRQDSLGGRPVSQRVVDPLDRGDRGDSPSGRGGRHGRESRTGEKGETEEAVGGERDSPRRGRRSGPRRGRQVRTASPALTPVGPAGRRGRCQGKACAAGPGVRPACGAAGVTGVRRAPIRGPGQDVGG